MKKFILLSLSLSILALTGCARTQIIIDPQGIDMAKYQTDLAECQQLADQVESKVAEGIVGGAIIGAIVDSIFGGHHHGSRTTKLSALGGGLEGADKTSRERSKVLRSCLYNRGYNILN
jgi:outer membrane lipoprotein SlyB